MAKIRYVPTWLVLILAGLITISTLGSAFAKNVEPTCPTPPSGDTINVNNENNILNKVNVDQSQWQSQWQFLLNMIGIDVDTGDKVYQDITTNNYYYILPDGKVVPVPPGTQVQTLTGDKHVFWVASITGDKMATGYKVRRFCNAVDTPPVCGDTSVAAPGGWAPDAQHTAVSEALNT